MKWKLKVVLRGVPLMNFILRICNELKQNLKSGVTRSIIDELYSSRIQRDQMEGETGVTQSIIDELYSLDIQGDKMEGECGVTGSIIDQLHSWDS